MMKKKYRIEIERTRIESGHVCVEADSEEEAKELILDDNASYLDDHFMPSDAGSGTDEIIKCVEYDQWYMGKV